VGGRGSRWTIEIESMIVSGVVSMKACRGEKDTQFSKRGGGAGHVSTWGLPQATTQSDMHNETP